ncbi:MAG: tyrosine-type recombinase/integrase, partial [Thiohalomonadales bacterium]
MRVQLNEHFVSTSLICPDNIRRIEYVSKTISGFFLEVRRTRENYGTFYYRGKNLYGKTYTQKIGTTDQLSFSAAETECKRLAAEQYLKLSSGIDPRNDAPEKKVIPPTLNQYYKSDYLPFIKQRNRSWKSANGVYTRYVKPLFGEMRVESITRKMVIDFHSELKMRGLAGATADHGLKILRHIINSMILNGVATDNPSSCVPLFNDFNEVCHTLSPEELQTLLRTLIKSKSQVALIARMLMATTCRLSEILSATWSNCDMDKRVLYIDSRNSKSKIPRAVPLNSAAMDILRQLKTQGRFNYLFISPKTKTRYFAVHKSWNKLRIEAGLPKLRLHDLRHFGPSELASRGVSIYSISKLLGHRNVVTSQRYSHVSQSAIRQLSDDLSTVIT